MDNVGIGLVLLITFSAVIQSIAKARSRSVKYFSD